MVYFKYSFLRVQIDILSKKYVFPCGKQISANNYHQPKIFISRELLRIILPLQCRSLEDTRVESSEDEEQRSVDFLIDSRVDYWSSFLADHLPDSTLYLLTEAPSTLASSRPEVRGSLDYQLMNIPKTVSIQVIIQFK